ncbi:tetratricopeptide repeat protein [Winogradskyella psychrotolerans]|uniref:histidine kinase dimerization/phosphoacceptor domain -containing protein n=1 Tax=Winogradskyella psychrotolerans TaxID=1344585 RepID=UPI001C073687|nr:histidine kinase dimerization/phosphoacceptor domain -containing protein [Winogradskyella psychrotolerans]MBU2922483.1 tetratricopeptide repeat protein [Winogradskyella psychrotolerans]
MLSFLSFLPAQNNLDKQKVIDSLISTVDTYTDNYEKIRVLTSNAGQFRYSKDSRALIDKAISISKRNNDAKLFANSYYSLGNFFYYNSQLDSAEIYLDKSISYVNDKTMPFLRASNLMTKSGIYSKQGNIPLALATMLNSKRALDKIDSLKLDKKQRSKFKGESLVLNNALANYYNQMEEFDKAVGYYNDAYEAALNLGSFANAGIIISNKGELLLSQGKYEEALKLFNEGKVLKEKGKAPMRFIMSSVLNIGNAHSKLKNYDKALKNLNEAHNYYEEAGVTENLTIAKNYRGNLYFETGKHNLAIEDCDKAKSLAIETGNLELTAEACDCLSKTYKATRNYDKALDNFQLLTKTKDSIFNKNNIKKQTQQEMEYEFNKTQELNAIELEAKEKQSKLYSYLAVLGLLLVLVLGFFSYRNKKQSITLAKQKKLLEASVDEKNVLLKETHHRVKNSFQIVSSLLYLQSESVEDKEAKIAIKEAENRVRSMVLIHQKLYNKDELVGINTHDYFNDLVRDIFESHQFESEAIKYELNVESLVLDIETITPIGLILNELIVNTIKHAFDKVTPESKINIQFHKEAEQLVLKVIDNGKGFEGEIKSTSFGITLMKALSKKLKATLNYKSELNKGTEATLVINKYKLL